MKGFSIIIPARYGSQRFQGKPLALICGRPMIQHVYERAVKANVAEAVIVATDDERILKTVEGFGGSAYMTSSRHKNGTERVAEVAKFIDSEWVINIQGDEPLIEPDILRHFSRQMETLSSEYMFSLMRPLLKASELENPNVVKVVIDNNYYALYFSRAPIPYTKKISHLLEEDPKLLERGTHILERGCTNQTSFKKAFIHCGIYGYKRDFLLKIPWMGPSFLEEVEGLEQLRILENGFRIKMIAAKYSSVGVDRPEDIKYVEDLLNQSVSMS